ncbi:hypothetical protein BpHYR1_035822 [Brachionus plicatilis]|uniref:Uncharacterized protein n=1 Tax=Brachionus plicatilis TaxID=10195 RepID=A0A3M7SG07_BRAPC|nr:hypothetical protein BpHYR1_035822 [Brachionus plicatilis]
MLSVVPLDDKCHLALINKIFKNDSTSKKDQIKIKRNLTCLCENQIKDAKYCKKEIENFASFKFIIFSLVIFI